MKRFSPSIWTPEKWEPHWCCLIIIHSLRRSCLQLVTNTQNLGPQHQRKKESKTWSIISLLAVTDAVWCFDWKHENSLIACTNLVIIAGIYFDAYTVYNFMMLVYTTHDGMMLVYNNIQPCCTTFIGPRQAAMFLWWSFWCGCHMGLAVYNLRSLMHTISLQLAAPVP